jgi:tRNA threonylcarbamoyladenosine biosynthesis protein TsaB
MKIQGKLLGLDSSAVAASCAITENGKILASGFVNMKITHSQTLMPLVGNTLKSAGLSPDDIDAFAVSNGPGSFTGLRIAVSAVKGMAFALNRPVCGVSTLLSLAYNLIGQDCVACAVMDARRGEVYNALFEVKGDVITRLTADRAISLVDLQEELTQYKNVVLVGDGAQLAYNAMCRVQAKIAGAGSVWQSAVSVCMAVTGDDARIVLREAKELMPVYIRKPQAEREREENQGGKI